ncbi:hypothetical protein PTTW11_10758 [Pyrenophora teres f. teres]|uniref:Uncharacterized protein n=1 Tax=Pyrenophora teres f. teres TaxID=97479 RepID=A0A6S6WFK6_9PLEO|nr:hypothetical protein PTTW11_10758 [Pyrenophora teres f. teres]
MNQISGENGTSRILALAQSILSQAGLIDRHLRDHILPKPSLLERDLKCITRICDPYRSFEASQRKRANSRSHGRPFCRVLSSACPGH